MKIHRRDFHRCLVGSSLFFAGSASSIRGDETEPATPLTYDEPTSTDWSFGFRLVTPSEITNGMATFPVPMAWPEQSVEIRENVIDAEMARATTRTLSETAQQVVVHIPRMLAGSELEVRVDMTITKRRIVPPMTIDDFVIPRRTPRELRAFMGASPHIDVSHPLVRKLSRELADQDPPSSWAKARQIYDAVRNRVRYLEGPIRNASDALRTGQGDCEDMTSLFVALCRNARIPARMVWVHGHCYPEFYLEKSGTTPSQNVGVWLPCQAAGDDQFGTMTEERPILQKGDRFRIPETRTTERYLAEFFQCDPQGNNPPRIAFFRRLANEPSRAG